MPDPIRQPIKHYPPVGSQGKYRLWIVTEERRHLVTTKTFRFGEEGAVPGFRFKRVPVTGVVLIECAADFGLGLMWANITPPGRQMIPRGGNLTVTPTQMFIASE